MTFTGDIFAYQKVMHAKQAQFHLMPERIRMLRGGNRSSKSTTAIAEAVMIAMGMSPRNARIPVPNEGWIVSEDHPVSQTVAERIFRQLVPKAILESSKWDYFLREFTLPNGSKVAFKSCDSGASKFAGPSKHWIMYDEPPDRPVRTECRMRLMDTRGDEWFSMTPVLGAKCWTHKDFVIPHKNGTIPKDPVTGIPDFGVMWMSTYDNPGISREEIQRTERGLSKFEIETRIYGRDSIPEGLVLPEFNPEIHVVAHDRLPKLQPHWPTRIAMDHGASLKSRGHSAAYIGALRDDGVLQVYDEYYMEIAKPAAYHSLALRRLVPKEVAVPVVYLDAKATQFRIELALQAEGLIVVESNNDHNQGFSRFREFLGLDDKGRPGMVISDRCKHLAEDIMSYSYDGSHDHSHSVDAARYLCCSMPRRVVVEAGRESNTIEDRERRWLANRVTNMERRIRFEEYGAEGLG